MTMTKERALEASRRLRNHTTMLGAVSKRLHDAMEQFIEQSGDAQSVPAPQPTAAHCPYCDGTGDVHRADGEWIGPCSCEAGAQPPAVQQGEATGQPKSGDVHQVAGVGPGSYGEWRPIATAPKFETILIWQPEYKRVTLSINDGFEWKHATHWMPLPAAPRTEQ